MVTPRRNVALPNNRGGSTGSVARRSCQTSSASSNAPSAASPRIGHDAQGNSVPPQVSASSQAVIAPTRISAPAKSIRGFVPRTGSSRSARSHRMIATIPSGTLIQKMYRHDS